MGGAESVAAMSTSQGGCGSCWAVTSAAVLSAHAEIHSKPRSFSAQASALIGIFQKSARTPIYRNSAIKFIQLLLVQAMRVCYLRGAGGLRPESEAVRRQGRLLRSDCGVGHELRSLP